LIMWHVTFGAGIETILDEVDSESTNPAILNSLFLAESLPEEVTADDHNLVATMDDFVDADSGNHHLMETSNAIDAASVISGVGQDIDGLDRIVGPAPDVGAHEYSGVITPDTGEPLDTGESADDEDDDGGAPTETEDSGVSIEDKDTVSGIGAAEQVGEKGGCGCHAAPVDRHAPYWLLFSVVLLRRRWTKAESGQLRT
jgi:hypothetical protein